MRRYLLWLLILTSLVLYSLLVYNWWIEGNNRKVQTVEQR